MKTFKTYTELEVFLRNWTTFDCDNIYDFNGILNLMEACLDNIRVNALEDDLERVSTGISKENIQFVRKLTDFAARFPPEAD